MSTHQPDPKNAATARFASSPAPSRLPELPPLQLLGSFGDGEGYTAAQMHDYAQRAISAVQDESARIARELSELPTPAPIRLTRNHNGDVLIIVGDQRALLHECDGYSDVLTLIADRVKVASRELLASNLIDRWVAIHNRKIPWATAVEIIATLTDMAPEERQRLLDMSNEE